MERTAHYHRWIALTLATLIAFAGVFQSTAMAGIVGTNELLAEEQAEVDRAKLLESLERDEVQEQLVAYGVDPAEAQERVANMTDEEVQELAMDIDAMPAGGNVSLVTVLLIVLLVVLIT